MFKALGMVFIVGIIGGALWALGQLWTLQDIKAQVQPMSDWVDTSPFFSRLSLTLFFTLLFFFSVPLASLTSLLAGAILGTTEGTILLSIGGALGGCGTFLLSRHTLGPWVEKRWESRIRNLRQRLGKQGPWILLSLRLQPICPYILINLFFGLTSISLFTFWWVSLVALIPHVLIWVYAGTLLMKLERIEDAVSPAVTFSLFAVAIIPWLLGRWIVKKQEEPL